MPQHIFDSFIPAFPTSRVNSMSQGFFRALFFPKRGKKPGGKKIPRPGLLRIFHVWSRESRDFYSAFADGHDRPFVRQGYEDGPPFPFFPSCAKAKQMLVRKW